MAIGHDPWGWVEFGAGWHGMWATRMEATTGGDMEGTGDLAGQDDLVAVNLRMGG
jgi:hypothetical protein